jgi:hypothetical protein
MSFASRGPRYWLALAGAILAALVIDAQWLKYPTPGVKDAGHLVGK